MLGDNVANLIVSDPILRSTFITFMLKFVLDTKNNPIGTTTIKTATAIGLALYYVPYAKNRIWSNHAVETYITWLNMTDIYRSVRRSRVITFTNALTQSGRTTVPESYLLRLSDETDAPDFLAEISVYTKEGELITKIEHGEVVYSIGGYCAVEGDTAVIYLDDEEYTIQIVGDNTETIHALVTEYDEENEKVKVVRYNNISSDQEEPVVLKTGSISESAETEYSLLLSNGKEQNADYTGSGDEIGAVVISTSITGKGYVFGDGNYTKGETVTLYAIKEEESDTFSGWYIENKLVSEDAAYSFICTESKTIEARFKSKSTTTNPVGNNNHGSGSTTASTTTKQQTTVKKAGWLKDKIGWWYKNADGSYPADKWQLIDGKWYFFNQAGYMATGWISNNNQWYYLNQDGAMLENSWVFYKEQWYFLKADSGEMATGWIFWKNQWYFLNADGTMKTGWLMDKDIWYYLNQNGDMAVDCITPDGYQVDINGKWTEE